MFKTLYSKLVGTLVVLMLLVGFIYLMLSSYLFERSHQSGNQQLNRGLAVDLVNEMDLLKNGKVDQQSMGDVFHMLMLVNPSIEIYYLDATGRIIKYSIEPALVQRDKVDLIPIKQYLSGDINYPIIGDDPRNLTQQKPFSVAALPDQSNPDGYLYVVLESSELDQIQLGVWAQSQRYLGLLAVLGSTIIALLTGILLFRWITFRLRRLNQKVDNFRRQRLPQIEVDHPDKSSSGDEINQLNFSFELMAARIDEQIKVLEEQDSSRREMVANISHDLRTPLSAIHGYLELLSNKNDELDENLKQEFYDTALKHSARLQRLITALFELSRLNAPGFRIETEAFQVADLLQDVVQEFKLAADQKSIELIFEPNNVKAAVVADIRLIETVLHNLIENAVCYTPASGKISCFLQEESEAIKVTIRDTGVGISPEQIEQVFERFYRAGTDHPVSGHAGLGLSICRKIIEHHETELSVESEPGKGTSFSFNLPKSAIVQVSEVRKAQSTGLPDDPQFRSASLQHRPNKSRVASG